MRPFTKYAQFYDLFYQEKDYEGECVFLERLFARYADRAVRKVLDLGCGTGGHALVLGQRGYEVTGVDRSREMIELARAKAASLPKAAGKVAFQDGDIRSYTANDEFDAVISMFAVVSYQKTDEDLLSTFLTARQHLPRGGLFVFDAWHGPGVLAELPAERVKTLVSDGEEITRWAHPEIDLDNHTVTVHYRVTRSAHGAVSACEFEEDHIMRFFFPEEIESRLKEARFLPRRLCPLLKEQDELSSEDWVFAALAEAV